MTDTLDSHVVISEILFGSPAYEACLVLRDEVLRRPLGLVLSEKDTATDSSEIILGAFLNSRLVGCLMLRRNSASQVQMRQVAVDPSVHGRSIGRSLVHEFELRARALKANETVMDARKTARAFYEKLGYSTVSDEYIQSTIPHFKMRKDI